MAADPLVAEPPIDALRAHLERGQAARDIEPVAPVPLAPLAWPEPLHAYAYHGLAGEITTIIAPHTEADPVAVLANTLVCFGAAVGRGPHLLIGPTRHGVNLFVVQVGESSRGRKGTALAEPRRLFALADEAWERERVQSGLSTGEGLIYAVRDPVTKREPRKEDGRVVDYVEVITDHGVSDKRLLTIEQEFAAVLRVATRDGNTLSTHLRLAWDGGRLQTLTRANPMVATAPHIATIGHITKGELLRYLDSTEAASGFGNRFLWLLTRRSQLLPFGGQLAAGLVADLARRLARALEVARTIGELTWHPDARALWVESYPALTAERPGLFGAVTGRGEAITLRLAMLYALLDGAHAIAPPHLAAALALWQYAEQSARCIFGEATGDPVADRILASLRTEGPQTQEDLYNLFARHTPAARIDQALRLLAAAGLVTSLREATGGRPRTIWLAA